VSYEKFRVESFVLAIKLLIMLKWIPNILTFGRGVLTVVFLAMLLYWPSVKEDQSRYIDIAFVIFIIAGLTDIFDGPIARRLNVASRFGRMADPLFDKILVCGAFICFAIIGKPELFDLSAVQLAVVHWSVAAVLILREVYVTVLRHVAEARGINFAATIHGKVKMFLQSFAIGTVLVKMAHFQTAAWADWFTIAVYAIMIASTIISGITATRRKSWQELRGLKPSMTFHTK
jgi:CDP-diacylglycerol--glycerol-3-phosphate 3-phosphatidyltransferase